MDEGVNNLISIVQPLLYKESTSRDSTGRKTPVWAICPTMGYPRTRHCAWRRSGQRSRIVKTATKPGRLAEASTLHPPSVKSIF